MNQDKLKAIIEAVKEIGRWMLLVAVSWIVTETLKQVGFIPEFYNVHVGMLVYMIPLRAILQLGLTLLGRAVDKYLYELGVTVYPSKNATGLTGF